jgi:hypothetical protein|uniref:Uncharacterized protein n=2 Tax=Picea TaxID=3328 RepID=A0A101LVH1_PICGL|nr:hypothetical protein ABT39_MTgene1920 [Picea glauca]QHR89906.1 hypothetical protein Q903MT_gene3928 [Picea sitchensis]
MESVIYLTRLGFGPLLLPLSALIRPASIIVRIQSVSKAKGPLENYGSSLVLWNQLHLYENVWLR